ncbi:MAG: ATP-binding cassette domain-containing protein [Desulfobacterales bacterium]|nr:ATP-binding cassette domain-containing protein [Desulfobacterales bacterium]
MKKDDPPIVKKSLLSWITASNMKLQILLLFVIIVAVLAKLFPLELQKLIINETIATRDYDSMVLYCGLYLVAIILAGGFKYLTGVLQTIIGQRVLAQMRKDLHQHILSLPLNFFRKTQSGVVVSALVTEIASIGDFVGAAIGLPITNVLTLVFFSIYLFYQNWILAAFSLAIYPFVLFVVPRLQRRVNQINKKRVDMTRKISGSVGESVTGIHEIHGNGSFRMESRKFDRLVDKMLKIRIFWNLYKLGVKAVSNFFNNLSPLIIIGLGAYLITQGKLDLGSLVAFLMAQEKLAEPWKELLGFYQQYQDASVRYKRTMDYFDYEPEHPLEPADRAAHALEGNIEVRDMSFDTESGIRLLDDVSFSLGHGENLALVGFSGSGKSTLAQCVGQLYNYTGGSVSIDKKEVAEMTKKDVVNNIGFVSQTPFIFSGTIEENLHYSHAALTENEEGPDDDALPSLDDSIAVLHQTGLFVDVLRFGLNAALVPDKHQDLIGQIVRVRDNFQKTFGEELADYVEFFDENTYLYHSSIAENLIFGTPNVQSFDNAHLASNEYFLKFLDDADLARPLMSLGAELSRQTVDILGDLPPDKVFFEQSPIGPEELEEHKILLNEMKTRKLHKLSDESRKKLLELVLRFTPGVHKIAGLPSILENLILEGRAMFKDMIAADEPEAISFYKRPDYIYSQTILNNILFGKTKSSAAKAVEKIHQSIIQLLIEEDLLETIVNIGMQFQVGSKGDKLSGGQRQKLAIARVFLKNPRILIMDEATSALDNKSQARIQNLLEKRWKGKSTLIAVVHRLDIVKNYDNIAVLKAGKIVEMGPYDELIDRKGMLYELEFGRQ